jgi:hypothetical protein
MSDGPLNPTGPEASSPGVGRARKGALAVAAALAVALVAVFIVGGIDAALSHSIGHGRNGRHDTTVAVTGPGTPITINGARPGRVFDGVGAISGGGGNSRLLIDYLTKHPAQAQQVIDYLFKPDVGASLQILKLEIGGDANATDGAEPSYEHTPGQINCAAGYELWLAKQALAANPKLQVYALQWNAPSWVGAGHQDAWTLADIRNVIGWLKCARANGVTISEVGGWNEHLPHGITGTVMGWFIRLRAALNRAHFGGVKIVAVDSFAKVHGADVAKFLTSHPTFGRAIAILGYHNVCHHLSRPYHCTVPSAAVTSGRPIWETEVGALQPPGGPGSLARSINNAYIEAKVTGMVEWPMLSSMPARLPVENLGLIQASQPWSGNYHVNQITWVIAQTTQFTQAGWRYVRSASGHFAPGGSYVSYEAPDRSGWSLVAQTSDARAPQAITVRVDGGLPSPVVHVWSTKLNGRARQWFARRADVHPRAGVFRFVLDPGYIYTFTSTTGQSKGILAGSAKGASAAVAPRPPRSAPMALPYRAYPDQSNQAWALGTMDGAFEYLPGSSQVLAQTARGAPDFWQPPKPTQPARFPYAVVGGSTWRDYTVSAQVKFTGIRQSAGLIARYDRPSFRQPVEEFRGYIFTVSASGTWRLIRNRISHGALTLATGHVGQLGTGRWHTLTLSVHGKVVAGRVDGTRVVRLVSKADPFGVAGICTGGWYQVLFRGLLVTR